MCNEFTRLMAVDNLPGRMLKNIIRFGPQIVHYGHTKCKNPKVKSILALANLDNQEGEEGRCCTDGKSYCMCLM